MVKNGKPVYEFGGMCLDPNEHRLLKRGHPVPLAPKIFDTLLLLVENRGHLVLKQDLLERLWSNVSVEDINLNRNISIVRKVLGESPDGGKYIETVPKVGFRFVADVREIRNGAREAIVNGGFGVEQQEHIATRRKTDNADAFRYYIKGLAHLKKETEHEAKKASEYFERAIQHDPRYALAYAQLACCYSWLGQQGMWPAREFRKTAEAVARKALALDSSLGEAHRILADVRLTNGDWADLENDYQRAIELSSLSSSRAEAHQSYAIYLVVMERFYDALSEVRLAQQLDPLSAQVNTNVGLVLYLARRYDQAIQQLRETLDLDSSHLMAHRILGDTYTQKGMYKEAFKAYEKGAAVLGLRIEECSPKASGDLHISSDLVALLCSLGHLYGVSGKPQCAQDLLESFRNPPKATFISPLRLARVYMGLKDYATALALLQKACHLRVHWYYMLLVSPVFDPLRGMPEFQSLLASIRQNVEFFPYRLDAYFSLLPSH